MSGGLLHRLLRRVRPAQDGTGGEVPARVLLGWYLRKGVVPLAIGTARRGLLGSAAALCFIGRGVRIEYGRRLHLGRNVSLGAGSRINAFSVDGVHLGDHVTIRENAWIQCSSHPSAPGAGLRVGDRTYVGPGAVIGVGGPIDIGPDCQIGAGVTLIAENHEQDEDGRVSATRVRREGITVGAGCWIGHRATILDGVTLGAGSVVGAGAVVTRSFGPGSRVAGVPARPIGDAS